MKGQTLESCEDCRADKKHGVSFQKSDSAR